MDLKSPSIRCLEGFHNRCIRVILGVSRTRQWKERITSKELASQFGMNENMADIIERYRCRWLGNLARMDNYRIPKHLLFGKLIKT